MSYQLISLCPNCGSDTSKNNKILYDGIFLICHECGHGWYYNIQTFEIKNKNLYKSKSAPLNTLQNSIKNYKGALNKKHASTAITRENIVNKNINHSNRQPKNNKPLNVDNSYNTTSNIASYSKGSVEKYVKPANKSTSLYNTNKDYSGNLYFKSDDSKNLNSNKKRDTLNNISLSSSSVRSSENLPPKQNITSSNPPARNTDSSISSSVSKVSDSKNLNSNKKSDILNNISLSSSSVRSSENLPPKQNITSSNPPARNTDSSISSSVSKVSDSKNLNSNKKSDILNNISLSSSSVRSSENLPPKQNITSSNPPARNTDSSISSSVSKVSDSKNLNSNKKSDILNNISLSSSSVRSSENLPPKQNITSSNPPARNTDSSISSSVNNSSPDNLYEGSTKKALNLDYPKDITKISLSSLRSSNKLNEENFNKAVNNFNESLNTKETLGLKSNNNMLLNFEATNKYNLENYKDPFITKEKIINEINNITKQLNSGIVILYKSILSIFTRLDLLLKALAYCTILFSAIGFLAFSEYKKRTKVSTSELQNSSYHNDFSKEQTSNVNIPENNNDITKSSKSYNVNNILDSKDEVNLTQDSAQRNHIDIKEYSTDNSSVNNLKSLNKNSNNDESQNLTFMQSVKASLSNGFYVLKSLQQNAFSNVKITNNSIKWKEITNNNFYLSTSLTNYSNSSNYIIKSLLVKFVNKFGQTLGERIIETNQVINNNSAVNINLTINNVPNNTNKIYTFIKNKQKLN